MRETTASGQGGYNKTRDEKKDMAGQSKIGYHERRFSIESVTTQSEKSACGRSPSTYLIRSKGPVFNGSSTGIPWLQSMHPRGGKGVSILFATVANCTFAIGRGVRLNFGTEGVLLTEVGSVEGVVGDIISDIALRGGLSIDTPESVCE